MDDLRLNITSFADMTTARVAGVAHAFDRHPDLRPLKVGPDPMRTKVKPSMEVIFANAGLPIQWSTLRNNGSVMDDSYEGGEIFLGPGRGNWGKSHNEPPSLIGHSISQHWSAATLEQEGAVTSAAALFEDLAVAMDAAYGFAYNDAMRPEGKFFGVKFGLPGIFWLNYFGPAFVRKWPQLELVEGARLLHGGAVLIETHIAPWPRVGTKAAEDLRAIFPGEPSREQVPTVDEHVAASPGTAEMPWEAWERNKAIDNRAKKYATARLKLATSLETREAPVAAGNALEWSTSLDLEDWVSFAPYLARKLKGELSQPVGKALVATITNAPLDDSGEVVISTALGVLRVQWSVGDIDTVDVFIFGSQAVVDVCVARFEE